MLITKTYKVRLYPTKAQEIELIKLAGATRFIWNHFLERRLAFYEKEKKTLSYMKMSRDLTKLRKKEKWLGKMSSDIQGASLRNLDKAYMRFFKLKKSFPNFKAKKDQAQSFQKKSAWSILGKKLRITKDLVIRFRGRIDPKMPKRTIVVSRVPSGKWYLTAFYKQEIKPRKRFSKPVGIDLGIKYLVTTSDGHKYIPVPIDNEKLAAAQRNLARKKIGSHNREKAKVVVTRMYERIANIRRDHTHKVSTDIVGKNHAAIVCENLNVKGMLGNHRLARSIGNANWSELLRQLEYKQTWKGGKFIKVDRFFPSSKLCSKCRFLRDDLPLNIRDWNCPNCGTKLDRDINAANNILKEGLGNSPAWRTWVRGSAKVV